MDVGSPLPRENDLCEIYGVSRTVLREALNVLSGKGLLDARPKRPGSEIHWGFRI